MQTIGIIRRFDDYGRIVVPKTIRDMVGFYEDEPIEICFDENSVLLRKFNTNNLPLDKLKDFIDKYSGEFSEEVVNNLLKAYDLIKSDSENEEE